MLFARRGDSSGGPILEGSPGLGDCGLGPGILYEILSLMESYPFCPWSLLGISHCWHGDVLVVIAQVLLQWADMEPIYHRLVQGLIMDICIHAEYNNYIMFIRHSNNVILIVGI